MIGWAWPRRHRAVLGDVLLWAVLSAPVAGDLGYRLASSTAAPASTALRLVGSLLLVGVAVAVGRRYPLVSLLLVIVPTAVDGNFSFAIPVMSYLVGLRMGRAGPAALGFAAIAGGGSAVTVGLLGSDLATWFLLTTTLLFAGVFPWLVGRYHRQHRALVGAGWAQAELLEREQTGALDRVRMRERARIAQDMHDSLGHDLSLIALRAGALELAADLDERHRRAAGELRASVGAATDRLHEIIGVLRDDAEPAAIAPPAGDGVAGLVARARDAGMAVRLHRDEADVAVPMLVDLAVYRVVQEALTNAARHAPGAEVTVRLSRSVEGTEVSVCNDAPPAGPLPGVSPRGGSGLVALGEWVRQADGTLRHGPRAGGFEVSARLSPAQEGGSAGDGRPGPEPSTSARQWRHARRRVRRSLLVAVAAPVAIAGILSLVYYPFATFHTVLPGAAFDAMRIGQPRGQLVDELPTRQVATRPVGGPPAPPGASCEFYTDGNFPLAQARFRLCFEAGRLVTKDRLD